MSEPRKPRAAEAAAKKTVAKKAAAKTATKKAPPNAGPPAGEKVLGILESLRRLGDESYPPTVERMLELLDDPKDLASKALAKRIAFSHKPAARQAGFVALLEDVPVAAGADRLLRLLLQRHATGSESSVAADAKQLGAELAKPFDAAFKERMEQRIEEGRVPAGVGALALPKPLFFLLSRAILPNADVTHVAPTPAPEIVAAGRSHALHTPPTPAFADRFDAAFASLDQAAGGNNYVTLGALRSALPDVPRATFDAELSALRRARRYSLDPSDGRHRQMTPLEREAGIMEAGHLLVYVARRANA